MLALAELGDRICILGPSNSGKSTLADAIARHTGLAPVHLDTLFHQPGPGWRPRAPDEFAKLHAQAIAQPRWVMDGNYSALLEQRLARATALIVLDIPRHLSLWRYLWRGRGGSARVGAPEGADNAIRWEMVRYILLTAPANRRRYRALATSLSIPTLCPRSARQIEACYAAWHLAR